MRHQDIKGASQDKPRTLKVVADIPAGKMVDIYLEPGQAARIMTGAPIPSGADAVVPVENTDFNFRVTGLEAPAQIKVFRFENVGAHIRKVGEDIRDGQIVLKSGHQGSRSRCWLIEYAWHRIGEGSPKTTCGNFFQRG